MARGKNPFLFGLKIPGRKKFVTDNLSVDNTSEDSNTKVSNRMSISRGYWADTMEKGSIYRSDEFDELWEILDHNSLILVMYIQYRIGYNKDAIRLDTPTIMKAIKVKSRSIAYKVRDSLIEVNVIARTTRNGEYWVNPHFIFKGSRVNTFPDNIIDVSTIPKNDMYNNEDC